jgi:hypothetical protein
MGVRASNNPPVHKNCGALRECHLVWRFYRADRSHLENLRGHLPDPTKTLPILPFTSPLPPAGLLSDSHIAAGDRQGSGWLFEDPPDSGPSAHSLRLRVSIRPLHRPETRFRPLR